MNIGEGRKMSLTSIKTYTLGGRKGSKIADIRKDNGRNRFHHIRHNIHCASKLHKEMDRTY